MKKISSLSLDALDGISRVTRSYLYELTWLLDEGPVSLDGVHVPLTDAPFCFEDYRCVEIALSDGGPALKVEFASMDSVCAIPLRCLGWADMFSLLEAVSRMTA